MALNLLSRGLSVTLLRNTSLLEVSFSHPKPTFSEQIANQVVRSYIDQGADKRIETSTLARDFIREQVNDAKIALQGSEKELVAYAQDNGITTTGTDVSLIASNMAEINSAISKAVQERLAAERLVQQIQEGNASSLPGVFESKSVQTTRQKISELRAEYQQKLSRLKPGFPEMVRLRTQILELTNQVSQEVASIARATQIKLEQAKQQEVALNQELAKLEAEQLAYQQKNIQYTILKREVDSNRTQYDSLIKKLNEVGVGAEVRTSNASIIDIATLPRGPYTPNMQLNIAAAFALAIVVAAMLIYIIELLNNTFSKPEQIETDLKLPVLGVIPTTDDEKDGGDIENPTSAVAEAYRTLRTSVQFSGADSDVRSIIVTSAGQSEGKSTTAWRLACDFAVIGRQVLVIDADMRRPNAHRLLKTHNRIGLSNLLSNVVSSGSVNDIFNETNVPNLTLISAGTIPPNPADLLLSNKMTALLQFCSKRYDLVIIDSPPVLGLSDAVILSRQADATLLVVASGQESKKAVKGGLERLKLSGGNIIGAVMTKYAADRNDYMYRNYYTYSETKRSNDNTEAIGSEAAKGRVPLLNRLIGKA
ncbi:MAG: polysaccharide biosynthesis tyrosine autokinase [Pseudomonadota bacterium]